MGSHSWSWQTGSFHRTIALVELVGQRMLAPVRNSRAAKSMPPLCPRDRSTPCQLHPRAKHLQVCTRSQLAQPVKGLASLYKRKPRKPILAKLPADYWRDWKATRPQFKPDFQASKTVVQQVMPSRSQAASQESMFPKKTNKLNKQKKKKKNPKIQKQLSFFLSPGHFSKKLSM